MKKLDILVLTGVLILMCHHSIAQKKQEIPEVKYRRSSLHTVLVQSGDYDMAEIIEGAFFKAPFPDKYNNHNIGENLLLRSKYPISDAEREEGGAKRTKAGEMAGNFASDATNGITDPSAADVPFQIEKFIVQNKIANKLVAKWWDRKEDGSFGMDLIFERGSYDASALDAEIGQGTVRGAETLAQDAGVELISKTFVVFNKMHFIENEKIASLVKEKALLAASKIPNPIAQVAATNAAELAYKLTHEGYTVNTTSFLYQLSWTDSVEAVFFNDYWVTNTDEPEVKAAKSEAFDQTDLFQLQFVGKAKSSSVVMPVSNPLSNKKAMPSNDVVELATVRNIDAVYAKLQKEFDVFKPMTPLYSVDPITARIGMKEGLEGGEKFEVLEQSIDPKTQKTIYTRKGTITVDKKMIWDNRITALAQATNTSGMSDEEIEQMVERALAGEVIANADTEANASETNQATELGATTFKGGGKLYPGILIRQLK
ncbi:MAG: hypothetical protein K9G41_01755 [Flavobacteriales bacterium]|nr:hypothetical protein [Flavobacteriales bacterium]